MRLTATTIRTLSLPQGTTEKTFFDADLPGFGLRLRVAGGKSWIAQYANAAGKTKRITLGSPDVVSVGQAREQAQRILAQVRLGADPAGEKRLSRVRAGETVGGLLPRFLARQRARLRPKSFTETVRHLERQVQKLHPLPVSALDRRTVASCLSEIAASSGPAAANRARGSLSAYCVWLMQEGLIENNPTASINEHVEKGPRQRLLSDGEVRAIWNAAGDLSQYGIVIRLLMLTGARREEIGGLKWSEIDLDKALISLPRERTKSGRGYLIPLSDEATKIIAALPRRTNADGARDLVFGSGQGGFCDWSGSKRDLDARITANEGAPLAPWVVHDLRRLISTALHERLGVPPHIVEACLAHAGGHKAGVAGTYNLAEYLDERRRALQRWADHLAAIVSGAAPASAVVRLRGVALQSA